MDKQTFLLLAGNSVFNKDWIYQIKDEFAKQDWVDPVVMEYKHWDDSFDPKTIIDLQAELKRLRSLISECGGIDYVFAKSAGSMLTLKAIEKGILSPKAVFIFGFPYNWAKKVFDTDIVDLLIKVAQKHSDVSFYMWQKSKDPAIGFFELKRLIESRGSTKSFKNIHLYEYNFSDEPIDDHHYANVARLINLVLDKLGVV